MKSEIKEVAINSFYLYLVQGLNYLLPLLTLPYLIKVLSVESFGIFSFAFAFSQFVMLFVDFGFNISVTKKIAENHENVELVKKTFWNVIFIKLAFTVLSFFIFVILSQVSDKIAFYSDAIGWSFLMNVGVALFPLWWFQGMAKMKYLSIINAISKLLTYPLIFVLVTKTTQYNDAIIIQSMSYVLAALFSMIYLYKEYRHYFQGIKIERQLAVYYDELKQAWPIFLSNSSISLYTNSLTILLGFFSSNYNVGLFGALERLVRVICFGVLGPINQATFPLVASLKKTNLRKAKKVFKGVLLFVFFAMSAAYILFRVMENIIVDSFFQGYNDISPILNVFIFMIFPIPLGGVLGQLGLLGLGGENEKRIFSNIYIWIGIASVPMSVILIKLYEVSGAISSMMVVESVIFITFAVFSKRSKFI